MKTIVKCPQCGQKVETLIHLEGIGDVCPYCLEFYHQCDECGQWHENTTEMFNLRMVCDSCRDRLYSQCGICGQWHRKDAMPGQRVRYDGNETLACPFCCLDYRRCTCCGALTDESRMSHDEEGTWLCNHCASSHIRCEDCGRLVPQDAATYRRGNGYCPDCYEELEPIWINDYDFKPRPKFHGDGPRYRGVELELDGGGERSEKAKIIQKIMDKQGYIKHDGSLHNGFEIVTEPCSLQYHMETFPWAEIGRKAAELGYKSHQAGTCGLHVHMSRNGFGADETERDLNIAKLLLMVEINWQDLVKFSRRQSIELDRWAKRYGETRDEKRLLSMAKGSGRYYAVNLQPRNTVEIRMFKGTLKRDTIIASIQLTDVWNELVLTKTLDEVRLLRFNDFAAKGEEMGFTELVEYIKARNLLQDTNEI